MVGLEGEVSNQLFEVFDDWNHQLQDFDFFDFDDLYDPDENTEENSLEVKVKDEEPQP